MREILVIVAGKPSSGNRVVRETAKRYILGTNGVELSGAIVWHGNRGVKPATKFNLSTEKPHRQERYIIIPTRGEVIRRKSCQRNGIDPSRFSGDEEARRIYEFSRDYYFDTLKVAFEEFCSTPDKAGREIARFMDVDYTEFPDKDTGDENGRIFDPDKKYMGEWWL